MPTETLHLAGQINSRLASTGYTKDQVFKACLIKTLSNPVTGKNTVYVEKRGNLSESATSPNTSGVGTAVFLSPSTAVTVSAFGATTSTVFAGSTNCGALDTSAVVRHISETIISGVTFYLMSAHAGGGWYLPSDSYAVTAYTADGNNSTTISDIKISGVNNTAGLYPGQLLTAGANIVAGTRVVSVNAGAFTAVLDTATTGGAFNDLAITKTPVAKMNDADFPTNIIGEFVELSGTVYIMDTSGKIWGSDLNSVSAWTATNFISANLYTDGGTGLAKDGDRIIGFGASSAEWFYNAGNATGSLLSKTGRSIPVGASVGSLASIAAISSTGTVICWSVMTGRTRQIWMLDGGSPKKISTPMVEVLSGVTDLTCLTSFNYSGGRYVFVSFVNSTNYNLMYSLDTGLWTDAAFPDAMILSALPGRVGGLNVVVRIAAVESVLTNGDVYSWLETSYSGSFDTPSLVVQIAGLDFGTDKRKIVSAMWLDADTQASGTATLECSDDDYANFRTLGTFDMTKHEKKITRLGSHDGERAYRLTHSANTAFRARALRIEYEVGT